MCSRQAGEGSGSYLPNEDFLQIMIITHKRLNFVCPANSLSGNVLM